MLLLAAHALCDYPLQGDFLGHGPCDTRKKLPPLAHCGGCQLLACLTSTPLDLGVLHKQRRCSLRPSPASNVAAGFDRLRQATSL
jgi:hypothetical protein